jgi:hypothetical protein
MKLPKLLRQSVWIALPVFVVAVVITVILSSVYHADTSDMLKTPWPVRLGFIVSALSFVCIPTAFILSIIIRSVENFGLRRLGRSATAKVLAVRETGETDNNSPVVRIKLQVQPPDGPPFEAVAEDVISRLQVGALSPGARVSVRYDPRTKEVALENAKRTKADNF